MRKKERNSLFNFDRFNIFTFPFVLRAQLPSFLRKLNRVRSTTAVMLTHIDKHTHTYAETSARTHTGASAQVTITSHDKVVWRINNNVTTAGAWRDVRPKRNIVSVNFSSPCVSSTMNGQSVSTFARAIRATSLNFTEFLDFVSFFFFTICLPFSSQLRL